MKQEVKSYRSTVIFEAEEEITQSYKETVKEERNKTHELLEVIGTESTVAEMERTRTETTIAARREDL